MQLFTSVPFTIIEQAPQLPVSHPIWLPVRSRSSRTKWISSLRASTSRSKVSPLIVTVIDREVDTGVVAICSASLRLVECPDREHLGEVPAIVARGVDVGRRLQVGVAD